MDSFISTINLLKTAIKKNKYKNLYENVGL